jgi:hypothetical protein
MEFNILIGLTINDVFPAGIFTASFLPGMQPFR